MARQGQAMTLFRLATLKEIQNRVDGNGDNRAVLRWVTPVKDVKEMDLSWSETTISWWDGNGEPLEGTND